MGAIQLFSALDRNNNNALEGNEIGLHTLQRLDKNKSASVTLDEWEGDVGFNQAAQAIESRPQYLLPDRFTEEDAERFADGDGRVFFPSMGMAAVATLALFVCVGLFLPPLWLIAAFFASGPVSGVAFKLTSMVMTAALVPTIMKENEARIEAARDNLKQNVEAQAVVAPSTPPASTAAALAPPSAKGPSLR